MNAIASMGKEYISKWGKYKLTTPVKRADIIKSYFINQIIWLIVGIIFAGAIFFPLFYLGGEERTGVFLAINLLCAVGITMGIITFANIVVVSDITIWKTISKATILLVCSSSAFALSYPLTVAIFRKKEY